MKSRRVRRAIAALAAALSVGGTVAAAGASTPPALVSVIAATSYTDLYAVATDPAGHVFTVDNSTGAVVRLNGSFGKQTIVGNDTRKPDGMTWHGGLLYLSNADGSITTVAATGGAMYTVVNAPSVPGGEASGQQLTWDAQGNLYVANYSENVIAEVAPGASVETTTPLRLPTGCGPFGTLIVAKTLYVSCYDKGVLVKASLPLTTGENTTVIPTPHLGEPGELAMDAHHNLYLVNYSLNSLVKVPLRGGRASVVRTYGTVLYTPWGLAIAGNSLYTNLISSPNLVAKIALPPAR